MTTDTKAPSLKPCPFCGTAPSFESTDSGCIIKCTEESCWMNQAEVFEWDDDGAIRRWNTRATPPAPTPSAVRERILALVDELLQADTEFENAYPGESKAALEALDSARARLEAALTTLLPDAAAIYVCYDGYGQYFISRERPASHVGIVYDEDAAEKVVDLFNNDTPDAAAIRAAAFEEAAKIADTYFAGRVIAAAIRAAGER
jgi:hypothetical protein